MIGHKNGKALSFHCANSQKWERCLIPYKRDVFLFEWGDSTYRPVPYRWGITVNRNGWWRIWWSIIHNFHIVQFSPSPLENSVWSQCLLRDRYQLWKLSRSCTGCFTYLIKLIYCEAWLLAAFLKYKYHWCHVLFSFHRTDCIQPQLVFWISQ